MNRARRYAIGCPIIPVLLFAGGGLWISYELRPVSKLHRPVSFNVRSGEAAAQIARDLRRRGLIRSERVFLWYASRRADLSKLRAGQYKLSPDMSAGAILDRLTRGATSSAEVSVTIPEGFTAAQIAHTLAVKGVIADAQAFGRLTKRADSVEAAFALPKSGLEGYLYPETYRFLPHTKPEKIAQTMIGTFAKEFYEPHRDDIARSGHTLGEVVTIASLIEREAEVPQDRARIAGVIENRLKRGMRLEIDATVLYALGHHKERVLYKDLQVNSPYNTYRHKGLPPGPISNPGKASLEAALMPERHAYLYYVASSDGSHIFTATEAEHNRAKARMKAQRQSRAE